MPAQAKGPRLWLRKARTSKRRDGRIVKNRAVWLIRDGEYAESTGCGPHDRAGAEEALRAYLNRRHAASARQGLRPANAIPVADVIGLYAEQVAPHHEDPNETGQRLERLLTFFGRDRLSQIDGERCRAYAAQSSTDAMARRDLEDFRAAINHHLREGKHNEIVSVVLPDRRPGREEWLTRSEAARLILSAWRYREVQKGVKTDRCSRRHVARFAIVGVYSGTRSASICAAALGAPEPGRGWIDLERGVFYRRPQGRRETKKRQTPAPLPRRLLAHLRRWHRLGAKYVVEWNGKPVKDCDKAFRNAVKDAGLRPTVTPHVLRHTAATWLMQGRGDPRESAEYLGMTLETLLRTYGHHHPDYLTAARDVFDRAPQERHSLRATDREQTSSNVIKISGNRR